LINIAGESVDKKNDNLYDAVLLGSKRIGHGFKLVHHPHLQNLVKREGICIECCPLSNLILGYVRDMKCHPVKSMLEQGIPVSLSSDDPGFFGYDGVTMDYVYAYIGWDLNLADLKKLCLNNITYSRLNDEEKAEIKA